MLAGFSSKIDQTTSVEWVGWTLGSQLQLAATLVSGRVQLVLVEQQCGSLGGRVAVREGGHTAHLAPTLPLLHSPTATAASIGGHWAYKRPSLG